jgi:N-acyl-D-amino-acid deacylase
MSSTQSRRVVLAVIVTLAGASWVYAGEPSPNGKDALRSAVARGLDVVTKAAQRYPENQSCFSCHHQTLPMLAAVAARSQGVEIEERLLPEQAAFTLAAFHDDLEDLHAGRRIGGRAMTVAYGLWALRLGDSPADATTEAMVTFLLKTQHDDGHWSRQTDRPPLEESNITCTTLAIYGLQKYASPAQAEAAIKKAALWLDAAKPESQEDKCFKLWSHSLLGGDAERLAVARQVVIASQCDDGGWAQLEGMKSDAYATGQTLWILQMTGLDTADAVYQRGMSYLLSTQCGDGSWLVQTRSKPIQPYFDNGDPHGKDQFISTPATCWAIAALAAAVDGAK